MAVAQKIHIGFKFVIFFATVLSTFPRAATGCSICTSLSPTLCDEMGAADLAVIARYFGTPEVDSGVDDPDAYKSTFQIEEVLKGSPDLGEERTAKVLFFPGKTATAGDRYLMHGNWIESDDGSGLVIRWLTPISLTDEAISYLHGMWELPENDVQRLLYATPYLNSADPMLRRDAFDEFGKAPYELLQELKPQLNKNDLIKKIENPQTPPNLKKLYYTLLTICGTKNELPFIVSQIEKEKSTASESLPALIACYLSLSGADGLPYIEQTYLLQEGSDYERRAGAAITALRFHGQEASVIEREKIIEVFNHMLERPTLGARILSDLARWKDWSAVDRVAQVFIDAQGDKLWVREPAARYLLACPNDDAKQHIHNLEKIDELAVRNARRFALPPTMSSTGDESSAPSVIPDSERSVAKIVQSTVSNKRVVTKRSGEESNKSSISQLDARHLVWLAVFVIFVVVLGWIVMSRHNKS